MSLFALVRSFTREIYTLLFSLSPPPPCSCRPVHGLIFLYKWRAEEPAQGSVVQDSRLEDIFFAKQVTNPSACYSREKELGRERRVLGLSGSSVFSRGRAHFRHSMHTI